MLDAWSSWLSVYKFVLLKLEKAKKKREWPGYKSFRDLAVQFSIPAVLESTSLELQWYCLTPSLCDGPMSSCAEDCREEGFLVVGDSVIRNI